MKAHVLHAINNFTLDEVAMPALGEDEVLVKVHACGICGSDISRVFTNGTYHYPLIPGHEFAGEVVNETESPIRTDELSDVDYQTGTMGDLTTMNMQSVDCGQHSNGVRRVGVFPLIPCGQCSPCREHRYEMCRNYSYLGSRRDGGFAEYVAVPRWNLIELPDSVSFEQAAMLEPMAVAAHAIRSAQVAGQARAAICGLGTIGLLVTMLLLAEGNREIYVICNKDFQIQQAKLLGISDDHIYDSRTQDVLEGHTAADWLLTKTDGGVDVFFECVGRPDTIREGIRATKPGGMVQMVGNPSGDVILERDLYWKILRNQLTVKGSWNSSYLGPNATAEDDWHYVLRLLTEERIHPERLITHRMSIDEIGQGFALMRDKSEDYVKVMMIGPNAG